MFRVVLAHLLGEVRERDFADAFEHASTIQLLRRQAAQRRSDTQASQVIELADAVASAPDSPTALRADWEYMATVIEAAGNLVFQLIMNSVRELYLPRIESFGRVVSRRSELTPLYSRGAHAIDARDPGGAARAIGSLAAAQEERMRR